MVKDAYLFNTLKRVGPLDLLIHLGDLGSSEDYIKSVQCPVEMISGNNDF